MSGVNIKVNGAEKRIPKPIFTVGIPMQANHVEVANRLKKQLPDYHVLCYITEDKAPTFQAFYPKDFDDIDIDTLRNQVLDSIEKQ